MAGTFDERIRLLAERVGDGNLTGNCTVDQIYAHVQHEDLHPTGEPGVVIPMRLNHPRGGQAKYLEQPLFANMRDYLRRLAKQVLDAGGPKAAMVEVAEDLSDQVDTHAPLEFGALRGSGHPRVTDGGAVVYDRPPKVGRLSDAQLRSRGERRRLGLGPRG